MLEITKKDDKIIVVVSLKPREFANESKIWIRMEDILEQIYKKYPKITVFNTISSDFVISNVKEPHSAQLTFRFEDEKRDLTDKPKRAKVKETAETTKSE